ncbi:aminoglycoside 3'-phosphotransferase [Nakamurella sp. PAMC28650]|jgi:kanamycin kinase|uniref:aminoglycoside 3'-phosphotransferase n=1 Tax=Nakamurella sp. PAMC28650 TaxID=2762325 RepID=UPI00164E065E|nr:aminoglycoside 3'-phosphotransferase [Nakamurella sp. PAMC28650]QNK81813.1 aminoglycoside 3'-phosphotransferase [Nakamurella sp. PAMC28650]
MVSGEPTETVEIPAAVRAVAAGDPIRPVWRNEAGGVTFQLGSGDTRRFAKFSPPGGIDLQPEVARLSWAARWVVVPQVLSSGSDENGSWMITAGLPGENAVTPKWRTDPASAVAAIGRGLRQLHDTAPVGDCPFDWSQPMRLDDVHVRATTLTPATWHPEHQGLTVRDALTMLSVPPPVDRLVVCHGDACAPNTLLTDDGDCSGRVDLGSLGVADRWADLAVATWSTGWNYGPGWEEQLLAAYGVGPDPQRTAYYRLLWDLGP